MNPDYAASSGIITFRHYPYFLSVPKTTIKEKGPYNCATYRSLSVLHWLVNLVRRLSFHGLGTQPDLSQELSILADAHLTLDL